MSKQTVETPTLMTREHRIAFLANGRRLEKISVLRRLGTLIDRPGRISKSDLLALADEIEREQL